jgi:hypothetical protein
VQHGCEVVNGVFGVVKWSRWYKCDQDTGHGMPFLLAGANGGKQCSCCGGRKAVVRRLKGLTQWQVAEAMGVSAGRISQIEHGKRQPVTRPRLR